MTDPKQPTQEQVEAVRKAIEQLAKSMQVAVDEAAVILRKAVDLIRPAMAQTLKEYRNEDGLTQKQVAEYVGVSVDTVKRWEEAETFPTARDILKLQELYRRRFDEIDWNVSEQPKQ